MDLSSNGIFITATDTNVGKTFIATGLIQCIKEVGIDVGVMKPVATGALDDTDLLIKSAGVDDEIEEVTPIFLPLEASPLVAKRILKREIDVSKIRASFDRLARKHEYMIVEGIGGVLVPITESYMVIEMIKDLGLPVVIVCRGALGTINHTLLTINALRSSSIGIVGVIANMVDGLLEEYAVEVIREYSNIPLLGMIPSIKMDEYMPSTKRAIREYVRYDLLIT